MTKDHSRDNIVLSCQLVDRIRNEGGKDWANLLALYVWYYRTARWQKTNIPKATNSYMVEGMRWGERQLRERKTKLEKMGLIKNVRRTSKDGKVEGWFVKVNFLHSTLTTYTSEVHVETEPPVPFSTGVVSDRQMLKVSKDKCLNKKEERRKREEDQPQNQNSNAVGVGSDLLAPAAGGSEHGGGNAPVVRTQEQKESPRLAAANSSSPNLPDSHKSSITEVGESNVCSSLGSSRIENNDTLDTASIQTRDEYVAQMSKRWSQLCGPDGRHILEADLESNTRRTNWGRQAQYWNTRLADIAPSAQEAWTLIARYLKRYYENNKHYPDMRQFLKGWRSSDWESEKQRIGAFCKSHMASIMMPNYLDCRADEGRAIPVKWFLSAADYQRWFMRDVDDGSPADAWDNRPSAGPQTEEEWERRYEAGIKREEEELRKKESLALIARARVIIRNNADDESMTKRVVDLLKGYCAGNVRHEQLRTGIETLEKAQGSLLSVSEGNGRVSHPQPQK